MAGSFIDYVGGNGKAVPPPALPFPTSPSPFQTPEGFDVNKLLVHTLPQLGLNGPLVHTLPQLGTNNPLVQTAPPTSALTPKEQINSAPELDELLKQHEGFDEKQFVLPDELMRAIRKFPLHSEAGPKQYYTVYDQQDALNKAKSLLPEAVHSFLDAAHQIGAIQPIAIGHPGHDAYDILYDLYARMGAIINNQVHHLPFQETGLSGTLGAGMGINQSQVPVISMNSETPATFWHELIHNIVKTINALNGRQHYQSDLIMPSLADFNTVTDRNSIIHDMVDRNTGPRGNPGYQLSWANSSGAPPHLVATGEAEIPSNLGEIWMSMHHPGYSLDKGFSERYLDYLTDPWAFDLPHSEQNIIDNMMQQIIAITHQLSSQGQSTGQYTQGYPYPGNPYIP